VLMKASPTFGREGYNAGVSEADRETRNVMVAGAVRHGTLMQLVRGCIYPI